MISAIIARRLCHPERCPSDPPSAFGPWLGVVFHVPNLVADARVSLSVNSNRKLYCRLSSWLGANFHFCAASIASREKYLLGPGFSNSVPTTFPARSTSTLTPTLIVP